jgi:hypothetical protein
MMRTGKSSITGSTQTMGRERYKIERPKSRQKEKTVDKAEL